MADGVVESGVFNAAGTELTLTLDTGGTVTIDVPAVLRTGMGAADGVIDGGSLCERHAHSHPHGWRRYHDHGLADRRHADAGRPHAAGRDQF